MRLRSIVWAAALLGCLLVLPAAAQDRPTITFDDEVFDVTGAGTLDLGDIDAVLKPYRRDFGRGKDGLELVFTVDRTGAVIDCRSDGPAMLVSAGQALCAHARSQGRFKQLPQLDLDYAQAAYRLSVDVPYDKPARGMPFFRVGVGYPLLRSAVSFSETPIPPEDQRLSLADLEVRPMEYPRSALTRAIEARVVVALTFDDAGKLAKCRPIHSSNTARMAYETCRAARLVYRRVSPARDAGPFVLAASWQIAD